MNFRIQNKYIFEIAVGIAAIVATIVSIKSCCISDEANKTAKEALKLSEEQFIQKNRPYINLKAVAGKDSNQYYDMKIKVTG